MGAVGAVKHEVAGKGGRGVEKPGREGEEEEEEEEDDTAWAWVAEPPRLRGGAWETPSPSPSPCISPPSSPLALPSPSPSPGPILIDSHPDPPPPSPSTAAYSHPEASLHGLGSTWPAQPPHCSLTHPLYGPPPLLPLSTLQHSLTPHTPNMAPPPAPGPLPTRPPSQPSTAASARGKVGVGGRAGAAVSLESCLWHFIRPEPLGEGESWVCPRCQRQQPATKQLSLRRLPPVLCLHVKRFEQGGARGRGAAHEGKARRQGASRAGGAAGAGQGQGGGAGGQVMRKVQAPLAFPTDEVDLELFTSAAVLRSRAKQAASYQGHTVAGCDLEANGGDRDAACARQAGLTSDGGVCDSANSADCRYRLFAVVCHKGDITGGHYIVYVRCAGAWYCCDDAWVTRAQESEVAAAQAYMLFLTHKQHMEGAQLGVHGLLHANGNGI
ncbi:hypothetical protein QJQ45_028695, partial [Haematococcus lacustris]